MVDNKTITTKEDATKKKMLDDSNRKVYTYGKKSVNCLLNLMSSEAFFIYGTLMIIGSTIGLFLILPYVDGKISQIDNLIDVESKNVDALSAKIQLSYYNIDLAYDAQDTSVILDEINASPEAKMRSISLFQEFMYRTILSKLNDTEASSFIKNEKEIISLEKDKLKEINDVADRNVRLRYNERLYEKNNLIQEKNKWLSRERVIQWILGFLNATGLLFVLFADRKGGSFDKKIYQKGVDEK